MAVGRSSGRSQDIAFGRIADDLQRAAFHFGAMAGAAQQLYSALQVFRELNKQLTLTTAIANGTSQTFAAMNKAVRDFALGTVFGASQSANALLFLSQAGFTAEQSITAMTGVLTLAQATLEDVNETADLVASSITSFGLEAADATRVANLFAASMNQSLASLPKIAFALRQVGPVAASAGVSIEDTTAALSELFNVGLRGEQAGTALRNVLVAMISPAGEAGQVMKTLGIQIYNTDGRMRKLFDILKDLSKFDLSDSDLSALFGREALAGGIALLSSARNGSLEQMRDSISGTQEALRVALEQMTSFDAAAQQARNSIDELRISFAEQLAPTIQSAFNYITDLTIAWRNTDQATKDYLITLAGYAAGVAIAIPIGTKLLGILGSMAGAFVTAAKTMYEAGATIVSNWSALRNQAMLTSQAVGLLGQSFKAAGVLSLGVGAAILAVGGVVYAFREARRAYDEANFKQMFGEFEELSTSAIRRLSNFRQINSANANTVDYLQGFAQEITNLRSLADYQLDESKKFERQAQEVALIKERAFELLAQNPFYQDGGKSAFLVSNEEILRILGIDKGASTTEIGDAMRAYIERTSKRIEDSIRATNPVIAKQFNEAIKRGLEARGSELNTDRPNDLINASTGIIEKAVNEIFGDSSIQSVIDNLDQMSQKAQADAKNLGQIAGQQVADARKRFGDEFIQTLRQGMVKDLSPEQQAKFVELLKGVDAANDEVNGFVDEFFTKLLEGTSDGKEIRSIVEKYTSAVNASDPQLAADIKNAAGRAEVRKLAMIFQDTIDQVRDEVRKSEAALAKALTAEAAATGNKNAEKAFREIEYFERLVQGIRQSANTFKEGLARPLQALGVSEDLKNVLNGSYIADLIEQPGAERERALAAIQDFETYQKFVEDEVLKIATRDTFIAELNIKGLNSDQIDPKALFAASYDLLRALSEGEYVQSEVNAGFEELAAYLDANQQAAIAILVGAGIPIETLNNGQIPNLSELAIIALNGGNLLDLINTGIRKKVIDAFLNASGFLDGIIASGKVLVAAAQEAVNTLNNVTLGDVGAAGAEKAKQISSQGTVSTVQKYIQELLRSQQEQAESIRNAGNLRTDNRGGGGKKGKTKEELLAELKEFLAERNEAIVNASLELAAYGEEFNPEEILQLRIDQVQTEFQHRIEEVKKSYEKMIADVAKGSEEASKLISLRDREIAQLEMLRDRNIEYANSAEFAARVQRESAQEILDKYIEMNTYAGTFTQGLIAGIKQWMLELKTEFQVGLDTAKELIGGFTEFGLGMFNGFFNEVATGQKSMTELLREQLAKMLMNWANYFAELALKYFADWALRKILGLIGGVMGGGDAWAGLREVTGGMQTFASGTPASSAAFAAPADMPTRSSSGGSLQYNSSMTLELGDSTRDETKDRALLAKMETRQRETAIAVIAEERRVGGLLYSGG